MKNVLIRHPPPIFGMQKDETGTYLVGLDALRKFTSSSTRWLEIHGNTFKIYEMARHF